MDLRYNYIRTRCLTSFSQLKVLKLTKSHNNALHAAAAALSHLIF